MRAHRSSQWFAGRRIKGMMLAVLMVFAAATVVRIAVALNTVRATLASAAPRASRSLIQDRLIGTRVSATLLPGTIRHTPTANGKSQSAHLIWIVDLESCNGCVRTQASTWNALRSDPTLQRHLVVSGDTTGLGTATRALVGTSVRIASADEIASTFGFLLPNTQLLVDGEGVIVMADSRTAVSECGWNFAAQVGSLRGILTSDLLRN